MLALGVVAAIAEYDMEISFNSTKNANLIGNIKEIFGVDQINYFKYNEGSFATAAVSILKKKKIRQSSFLDRSHV